MAVFQAVQDTIKAAAQMIGIETLKPKQVQAVEAFLMDVMSLCPCPLDMENQLFILSSQEPLTSFEVCI